MKMKIIKAVRKVFPWLTRECLLASFAELFLNPVKTMEKPPKTAKIYIAGLLSSFAGVASGARAQLQGFQESGKEVYGIDLTDAIGQKKNIDLFEGSLNCGKLPVDISPAILIVHQNPRWFVIALHKLGPKFLKNKYIIAYWAWELEDIPEWWLPSLKYVHEIWVPSSFVKAALTLHTDKAVKVFPHLPRFKPVPARDFGVDGKIRVLYIFDFGSSFTRKNPIAAVKAFKAAFGKRDDAELLVKVSRPGMYPAGWEELRRETAEVSNIRLIKDFLLQDELDELYRQSDIYLSLHRSEGFGLTIFEAMNFGLECVVTGWSGNMDFFHGPKCHPVNYKLIPVNDPQNIYPYPECQWAEPDINHAAEILTEITEAKKR